MAIAAIYSFEAGVGFVSARAYKASWQQAAVFTGVNGVVSIILRCLVASYVQNTRQFALADIAIQVTAGVAGALMTRLLCEKTIHWKPALASSVCSVTAVSYACLFMESEPLTEIFG